MRILAIETSCDDTAVAILEVESYKVIKFKVLSNIVSSQKIHQNYGGVFPMMAKREHQANLTPALMQALKQAKLLNPKSETLNPKQIPNAKLKILNTVLEKEEDLLKQLLTFLAKYEKPFDHAQGKPAIDAIAVTHGPGLEPCLWVGGNCARALSAFWNIPIIPVNHIEGHILVNFLPKVNENPKSEILNPKLTFPAISLVVSGGHTQLILVKGIGKYKIIGETRDDAAGECFDKAAKILGLGYPGGPIIAEIVSKANNPPRPIKLPRPMMHSGDYDFSFSGLKTAILYAVKGKTLNEQTVEEMCVEIQQAIIDVLLHKTIKAAKDFKAKTIILGGGVSANQELRKQLAQKIKKEIPNTQYLIPDTALSTDNALMIAITAFFHKNKKASWKTLKAKANLRVGN